MVDGWANLPFFILEKIFWYANYQTPLGHGRGFFYDDSVVVICSNVCCNWWNAIVSSNKLIQENNRANRVVISSLEKLLCVHKRGYHSLTRKFVRTYDVEITELWKSDDFQLLNQIFHQSPIATNFIIRFPFGKDDSDNVRYKTAIMSCFQALFLSITYCNNLPKSVSFELTKTRLKNIECNLNMNYLPCEGAFIKNLEFRIKFPSNSFPFNSYYRMKKNTLPTYAEISRYEDSEEYIETEPNWTFLSERGIHIERTFLLVDLHQRTLLTFISDIHTDYLNVSWRYAPCLSTIKKIERNKLFFSNSKTKEVTLFGDSRYFNFRKIMQNLRKLDLTNLHLHIKKSAKSFTPMLQRELNLASVTHGWERLPSRTDTLLCPEYFVFKEL